MAESSLFLSGWKRDGLTVQLAWYFFDLSTEDDTFFGLEQLKHLYLQKNCISAISKHAFRGLLLLKDIWLSWNRLRSVPVDALLHLEALQVARLTYNHITTVDDQVMQLGQNYSFALMLRRNMLSCDKDLTWFICNLPQLELILHRSSLKCASPAHLQGTVLTVLRERVCPKPPLWTPKWDKVFIGAVTTRTSSEGPQNVSTLLYDKTTLDHTDKMLYTNNAIHNKTTPTENNTHAPYASISFAPIQTTETVYISLFGGGAILNLDDNGSNLVATILAVLLPLLLVLSSVVLFSCYHYGLHTALCNIEPENEDPNDGTIEPYAVVYSDSTDLQAPDGDLANDNPPITGSDQSEGSYKIQSHAERGKEKVNKFKVFAVIHHKDNRPESQSPDTTQDNNPDLKPQAIAHDNNQGPHEATHDDNPEIQPYAVTFDLSRDGNSNGQPYAIAYQSPQTPRCLTSLQTTADQQETIVKQPLATSWPTRANTPHCRNEEGDNPPARGDNSPCENATDKEETIVKQKRPQSWPTVANTRTELNCIPNYWNKEADKDNTPARYVNTPCEDATDQDETIIKQAFNQSDGQSFLMDAEFHRTNQDGDKDTRARDERCPSGMGEEKEIPSGMLYRGGSKNFAEEKFSVSQVLYNTSYEEPSGHSLLYEGPLMDNGPSQKQQETEVNGMYILPCCTHSGLEEFQYIGSNIAPSRLPAAPTASISTSTAPYIPRSRASLTPPSTAACRGDTP
uniref:LRRCT domain-containing protein n=1 Tax=Branchiostoma floridae TaxID=7739 RepID=C3Z4G2_BRAFL|eukprot:XP_002596539.1 hypothetical protein BRAFLDRAFT_96420 [Branchiostoma floridae]